MFKINDELFINLEPFLDLSKLSEYHEQISYGIAKNCDKIYPTPAHQETFLNQELVSHEVVLEKVRKKYPEFSQKQSEAMAKYLGSANLGSTLRLKVRTDLYKYKHLEKFSEYTDSAKDFKFLFDWLEEQDCFEEFGRTMFFLNDPWQQGVIHCDYGKHNSQKQFKDMFIHIRGGLIKKQFFIYDEKTGQKHDCPYSATIFNNNNYHGSINNNWYSAWSLRIDGVFKKSWADKVKISDYFNLS